jgi:predicted phosphodiesterase
MGCSAYRWTPEVIAKIAPALAAGGSIMAAARILNVGENALRSVIRVHGIDHRAICGAAPLTPPTAPLITPSPPRGNVPSQTPAWQGYSPRAGWSPPERIEPAAPVDVGTERVVCLADVHLPHHDRKAWATALALVRELDPTRVVLLGDFMEVESVSQHPKSRPDLVRLAEEFYAANVLLDELQDCAPSASFLYLEGNHEARCSRFSNEMGSLDGLMSLPESLYIVPRVDYHRSTGDLRGMTWVPLSQQPFVVAGVGYLHGVFEGIHHAMQHAQQLGPVAGAKHLVYGHLHAVQHATAPSGHQATCAGWLGDIRARTIQSYVKGRPRPWSHAMVYQEIDGDLVSTSAIPILTGRAVWAGARFVA